MIYSLQKRFIKITAFSIGLVFALIFGIICLVSVFQINDRLDRVTGMLAENDGRFPDPAEDPEEPPKVPRDLIFHPETQFSIRFFVVWTDEEGEIVQKNTEHISSVSDTEAEEYTEKVTAGGKEKGWTEEYRYRKGDTQYGKVLVFVYGGTDLGMLRQSLWTVALVMAGSFLIILLLILFISKRAVKPVAEVYEKQKQFVTDVNHELKTPLTLILSNLDIIESEGGQNEWLEDIRSEGERMTELVNQLVMLSRMDEDTWKITAERFDLSDMAADILSEFENLALQKGKKLSVRIDPGLLYQGDEGLIRRLLSILLDNGVKYCDPKGSIWVKVYQKGRHPVILVENAYREVDRLELNRLFDRFYRADRARTFQGGFGVGLSIARGIARKHKGDITAYKKEEGVIGFKVILK